MTSSGQQPSYDLQDEQPVRRMRLARLARQLSQDQLAEMAGVTRQAVAGFEAGRFDPSLKVALRLADVLGVSVEELFGGDHQRRREVRAELVEPTEPWIIERRDVDDAWQGRQRVRVAEVAGRQWAYALGADTAAGWGFGPATGLLVADGAAAQTPTSRDGSVVVAVLASHAPTVVVAGCDPALPLLAAPLARQDPPMELLWWPCSSSRALELVEAGAVHAAGAHLRDRDGRSYNAQQTREVLGAVGAAVVGFASWSEGLAVGSRSIRDLTDVARLGLRVVNREPGAEAREVLDRERSRRGLAVEDLPGWDAVVGGHLQVAAAVASGLAHAGVTCEPAARAYGLGFHPLAEERFDLVVPRSLLATPEVRGLLGALGSDELRRQLSAIDGYDASACGTVIDTF
jgi:putative molybdopterin biosynthesis protein